MAVTAVNQINQKPTIAAEPPKGRIEEMATTVLGATETFFTSFTSKVDELSGKWLGLENKKETERLPFTTLHPYKMPEKAKALLSEKLSHRSIQAMLLFLVALRIDNNAVDRHLRAKEKATSRHDHMDFVNKTRDETEKTAKRSTYTSAGSAFFQFAPMGVGYLLGQNWLQSMTTDGGAFHNLLGCPDLTEAPARDDATKLLRQVLQAPAGFFQQDAQTHSMMLQGVSFFYQSQAQKALEKGQSASGVMREISQTTGRDIDEAGRLLDAILQSMQKIHQQ